MKKTKGKRVKLVQVDERTWIEVSVSIPDKVAKQEFLNKFKQGTNRYGLYIKK